MSHEHKHASVIVHVSHPEGLSEEHEKALADAAAKHVAELESKGFEVEYAHHHTHGHHTVHHKPANMPVAVNLDPAD